MLRYPLLRWGCALKDLQMVKPAPRQDDSIHSSCRGAGAFLGLMPGLCVRGVGFCSVCQGFERCVHALKACMVHGARNRPRCGVCGHKLVKNGKTSAGRTRWRCRACGASRVINRPDTTRRAQASLFVSWLVAGVCVKQLAMPTTSFARKVSWC